MGRPAPDRLLIEIADYAAGSIDESVHDAAYRAARYCLLDSLGVAILALRFPECAKLLGPIVPGTTVPGGVSVPGTEFVLDPVKAAFDIGVTVRWLDFNDTFLAAEWGHPSDNFGGILAAAAFESGRRAGRGDPPLTIRDVLEAAIQAYEIQGVLSLENAFNRVGIDHVLLVRIASSAVVTRLLGGSRDQILDAVSNAWLDNGPLRTYRQAPNTGSRKSWAAGDATSRAVGLALMTLAGEMGYPSALTAPTWGFQDVVLRGRPVERSQDFGTYVIENVLFKVSHATEFHAQTALEAAIRLHPQVASRLDEIAVVEIETQEPGARIIDKRGPLSNPADRDHCIQYITAVGLIHGTLTADHYEDEAARDPRIDALRDRTTVREDPAFTRDYFDPTKRSIANALRVRFTDGTSTDRIIVDYPVGHPRRRAEAEPLLVEKFRANLATRFGPADVDRIASLFLDHEALLATPVTEVLAGLAVTSSVSAG